MLFSQHLVQVKGFFVHLLHGTKEANGAFKIDQTRTQLLQ